MMRTLVVLVLVLWPARAAAETPRAWSAGLRSAYVVMGGKRPTGGLMPMAEAGYSWRLGETTSITAGASFGVFGFGAEARWLGVLGGPMASIRGRPWTTPLEVGLSAHADVGRIPTCNDWGICLQYLGFFPAASAALSYVPAPHTTIGLSCSARRVSTLGWSGFGVEPSLVARYAW